MRRSFTVLVAIVLVASGCGDSNDSAGVPEEIARLIVATEEIRGLTFIEPPNVVTVSDAELARRVEASIDESLDPEEMAVWQALYELLGLLDGSIDLGAAYKALYAEQVGGFYDPDTGELVVASADELTPLERSIVVHELVHALTDQHFEFAAMHDELVDAGMYDEALALHAFVEGDATYFQLVYLQGLPTADQIAAVEQSLATETDVLDSLPPWFAEDLTFPYDAGFRFVASLVDSGGIEMVDQAYLLPPQSTEQILYPDLYPIREPAREVTMPSVDLPGFEVVDEGSFGAWNLQLLLLDGLPDSDRVIAAAGWGGDRYRVYWDGSNVVFAYLYEGDTPDDTEQAADALGRAIAATMGLGGGRPGGEGITTFDAGSGFAQLRVGAQRILFVAASDASAGFTLANELAPAVATVGVSAG